MHELEQNIDHILLTEEQIQSKVREIAEQISKDYAGKQLLLVGILKGSMPFMADLMRYLTINAKIDFMSVSSYGNGTVSSGQVRIILDLNRPVENYDLLIVEDILDSGATLSYIREWLSIRKPRSFKIATLLDKPARRKPTYMPITAVLIYPMNLLSDTVWIMRKITAISPISVY